MKLKTIVFPAFIALLASMTLSAQSPKLNQISISLGSDEGVCVSTANSVSDAFTAPVTIGSESGGAGAGKASIAPLAFSKNLDQCSATYVLDLFTGKLIPTVTITFSAAGAGPSGKALLTLTLRNVHVTSFSSAASDGSQINEQVVLVFGAITIKDNAAGTTVGCDQTTNVCQ